MYKGFSMAMLNNQIYIYIYTVYIRNPGVKPATSINQLEVVLLKTSWGGTQVEPHEIRGST